MTALVRRMGALLIQQKSSLFRFCTAVKNTDPQTAEEKTKKAKTYVYPKENFTNVEGLKEFFDQDNFFEEKVPSGRSWNLDELRIKSNSDLHKLWFVLLKEYNMLLTLEAEAKNLYEPMPNPERRDRVEISMENLEFVVRERNKAYFDLEVGETGEQPVYPCLNWMGLVTRRSATQHCIPQRYNKTFNERNPLPFDDKNQSWFLNNYREIRISHNRRLVNRENRHAIRILQRNPNADIDALKARYPSVDFEKIERTRRNKGEY